MNRQVRELAHDLATRIGAEADENGRAPTQLVASLRFEDDGGSQWQAARSKRGPLRSGGVEGLTREAMALLLRLADGRPKARLAITLVGLTAEGFEAVELTSGELRGGRA